jgi:hypothetical protein
MNRLGFGFGVALAFAATFTTNAHAYCPSYSPSSPNNKYNCGVDPANGTNPTNAEWQMIFDLVSRGPASWGNAGPAVPDIGQGCGKPEANHSVPARYPCELLKGIAKQESGWRQFCVPDTPADQAGGASRTIISFDCGYGVGQVTSGMHKGESPGFDRARVAADATYNLATGTLILADKWRATECVGDNQPAIIEDWYTATWAYNGLAYSNNPNNPNYDSGRGVWDPNVGGSAPYQEKIFGWIEKNGGAWAEVALAYPDPAQCGGKGSPPALDEPACASPTDCVNKRAAHTTACVDPPMTTSATSTATSTSVGTATSTSTGAGGAHPTSSHSSSGTGGVGGAPNDDLAPGGVTGSCHCAQAGGAGDDRSPLSSLLAIGATCAAVVIRSRLRTASRK